MNPLGTALKMNPKGIMPIDFIINAEHGIVVCHGTGVFNLASARQFRERMTADSQFSPEMSQVIDFRDISEIKATAKDVQQLAEDTVFSKDSRRAFVVASQLQFGLSRMFGTLREVAGEKQFRVFRDMDEAVSFVGVDPAVIQGALAALRRKHLPKKVA